MNRAHQHRRVTPVGHAPAARRRARASASALPLPAAPGWRVLKSARSVAGR